ncbi:histidine phosphatase superfamily [Mariannaea sp. PMI_226]|nr:histidine phosphatase superfamily [Mariannaea sp. PMI_226]
MASMQPPRLFQDPYNDDDDDDDDGGVDDIERHRDSQTALLSHYDHQPPTDDGPEASRVKVHNVSANPMLRKLNCTCARLENVWSPSLDPRQVTWIPEEFWEDPPRVVGTYHMLEDIRNGNIPPPDAFQKVDDSQVLSREEYLRYRQIAWQVAEELKRRHCIKRRRKLVAMALSLFLLFTVFGSLFHARSASTTSCTVDASCDDISRIWGQYSPVFSVPSDIDLDPPKGCTINFAQALLRHGARYPTSKKSKLYNATLARIQTSVTQYGKGYEWIKDYTYNLGSDDLTGFGQDELTESGKIFWQRYKELAKHSEPFIRTSGADRVIMSSYNFTTGFYEAQGRSASAEMEKILIIPEGDGWNNTLSHGLCPAFEDGWASVLGDEATKAWRDIFIPSIMKRLNENLPGANLTDEDVIYMMDLCPFNTVNTEGAKQTSRFCDLFAKHEWRSYNYHMTLGKFYGYGNGNPLGPTQGVGYVNELIARLTQQQVADDTNTNRTLDSSLETFPVDRGLYADFSHDNSMTSIFSAMGLYNETQSLSTNKIVEAPEAHGFSSAWVVPFAARMYVEKMDCGEGGTTEQYVRVLINDRVMPLKTCGGDEYGRCKLEDFIESLSFARSGGLWSQCAAES